jgi:alpha-tubulin suppressor-like RCC1 family protein
VNQGGRFLDPTDLTPQLTPIQIGTAASWKEVFPTGDGACALRQDNSLWCWGNNHFGQAGLGDTEARSEPAQVGQLKTWTSMGPAYGHTLAIQSDGSLWGWGDNFGGRLSGEVKSGDRVLKPRQLAKDSQWLLAAGGGLFSCAVRTDATAWCWGNNAAGQVGAGRGGGSFREPQRVLLPEE